MTPEPDKHPRSQARYIDRDFSWLTFNRRVLAEARSPENPLLERLKFLSIVANNLDEFFEVRVAGLLQKVESAVPVDGIAGLDCKEKLTGLLRIVHAMVAHQYRCWNDELIPQLGAKGIRILGLADLGPAETEELRRRFHQEIFPLLTPIKVGQLPRSLALSSDGSTLYVANSSSEYITVVDPEQGRVGLSLLR